MNETFKKALHIAFVLLLIWIALAAFGVAPGGSVNGPGFAARVGPGKNKCKGRWRKPRTFVQVASGMTSELVSSIGTNTPPVGWPGSVL